MRPVHLHAARRRGGTWTTVRAAGMMDLTGEKSRLEKELKETESHIEQLEKLLSSDFADKAPAPVVQKERVTLTVGKPFHLQEYVDRQKMLREGTEQIMESLAELLPESYRGKYRGG